MLTIFANMMISSPDRLQHLKDSFQSFSGISNIWLINIRGQYREEALSFLADHLGDKMLRFDLLDEQRGWYANSLDMLKKAKDDYIFLWLEDHLNLAPIDLYQNIISEMKENNVDYLMYSWWMNGISRKPFELDSIKNGQYIDIIRLNKNNWHKRLKAGHSGHLISLLGIFKKDFMINILEMENRFKFPRFVTTNIFRIMIILSRLGIKFNHGKAFDRINTFFRGRFQRHSQDRPFDFERSPYRLDILPITMALSKRELFACIDDDLIIADSQLIKRGLYPIIREIKVDAGEKKEYDWGLEEVLSDNAFYVIKRCILKKDQGFSQIYYQDEQRISVLPLMTIICQSGMLEITIGNTKSNIVAGQTMTINSNLHYKLSTAESGCEFILVIPKNLKKIN